MDEFPPRTQQSAERDVDLSDPWDGPRTFAEDFYSGGELRGDSSKLTPSHLTPRLTPQFQAEAPQAHKESEGPEVISILDSDEEDAEVEPPEPRTQEEDRRSHTRSPIQEEDFDESSVQELYAQLDEDEDEENHDEQHIQPTTSSIRDLSPPHVAPTGHVDWNNPPAFPGKVATKPGHILTPDNEIPSSDPVEPGLDLEQGSEAEEDVEAELDAVTDGNEEEEEEEEKEEEEEPEGEQVHEILEISDDEEDDVGPAPLGTSDLVIPDDREEVEETEEVDQLAGDDAPNEASELIAAVVAQLNESHAAAMEDTPFVPVEGMSYFDHCQRGLTTVLLTTYLFSRIHSYCLSGRSYVRRTRIVVPRGFQPGRWLRFYGGWFWFPSSHSNRGRCYELLRGSHTPF